MNKVTQLFTLLALTSACDSTTIIKQDAPDTSTSTSTDSTVGVQGTSKVVPVDATTWHNTSTATSTNISTGGVGTGGSAGAVSPDSGGEGGEGAAPTLPTGGATTVTGGSSGELGGEGGGILPETGGSAGAVTGGSSGELGGEGGGILPETGGSAGAVTGGTGPLLEGGSGGEVPELVPVTRRSTLLPDGMQVPAVFTAGDFTVQKNLGITVLDPVIVGGNLSLADTVVVVGEPPECNGGHTEKDALIVNGSITGASAHRWGNIRAGGSIGPDVKTACGDVFPESVELPIDISSLHDVLLAQSEYLAALDPNGSVTLEADINHLSLNGTDSINVFMVTSDQLQKASQVDMIVPAESTTIINVVGDHAVMAMFDVTVDEICAGDPGYCRNVLWNFPDALSITVSKTIIVQGTILAPRAAFENTLGITCMYGSMLLKQATWSETICLEEGHLFSGELCNDASAYPCTTWH